MMSKMNTISDVQVRPAQLRDRDFILSLVPRLIEFGPPPWRTPAQMTAADQQAVDRALSSTSLGIALFIAQDNQGSSLGFIHLNTATDYYTHEDHGHVSDVAVAEAGEGRGVGRALMEAGEEWARDQGYRLLTLNVFVRNVRARKLYEKLGYGEDTIKYVKELR